MIIFEVHQSNRGFNLLLRVQWKKIMLNVSTTWQKIICKTAVSNECDTSFANVKCKYFTFIYQRPQNSKARITKCDQDKWFFLSEMIFLCYKLNVNSIKSKNWINNISFYQLIFIPFTFNESFVSFVLSVCSTELIRNIHKYRGT